MFGERGPEDEDKSLFCAGEAEALFFHTLMKEDGKGVTHHEDKNISHSICDEYELQLLLVEYLVLSF